MKWKNVRMIRYSTLTNDDKLFGDFYAKNYESRKISMVVNNFSSLKDEIVSKNVIFKDIQRGH